MSDRYKKYKGIVDFIKNIYGKDIIPLHEPVFAGNEKKYINQCIDSTFVSSIGEYVNKFEEMVSTFTSAKYTVATVNGTSGLHIALKLSGVESGNEVITQPLTFVATCNAISYLNARPVFIDVSKKTLGLSPDSLSGFLSKYVDMDNGCAINKKTLNKIKTCIPVHTFGIPCEIDKIVELCSKYNIKVVEDASESLGSYYKKKHTGGYGLISVISFNGNKIITSGGGGMIITNNKELSQMAKHITTTSRIPDRWEYVHDCIGYNYRMPNINAALGCAQLEQIEFFLQKKREIAKKYSGFFKKYNNIQFFDEPENCKWNGWLNTIIMADRKERDEFLEYTNNNGIMTRPAWRLMHKLDMYKDCFRIDLSNAEFLESRIVNIPSSANTKI